MNAEVWGPHFWFTLHTVSMNYPINPNTVTKKKYYEFITNLPLFLPHPAIGNHFAKLLDEYPVEPYLSSRLSFMKWVHFIHNNINGYLGKKAIAFDVFLEEYYKHYEPKDITNKKQNIWKKRYIEIGVVITLIIVIFYGYKK